MFELFSGEHRRVPRRKAVPVALSIGVHLLVIAAICSTRLTSAGAVMAERFVLTVTVSVSLNT